MTLEQILPIDWIELYKEKRHSYNNSVRLVKRMLPDIPLPFYWQLCPSNSNVINCEFLHPIRGCRFSNCIKIYPTEEENLILEELARDSVE